MIFQYILTAIAAYLLGSVSTSIVFARLKGLPDPRTVGSKSAGATNSLRTMGKMAGLVVLLGDACKALLACLVGWLLVDMHADAALPPYGRMIAATFVVFGHIWPCFFGFKGGKGVACIIASMLTCFPMPALVSILVGLVALIATKMVSVGSITGVAVYAILSIFWFGHGNLLVIAFAWVIAGLCIYKHRTNIARILKGQENQLHLKK